MAKVGVLLSGILLMVGCGGGGVSAEDLPDEFSDIVCSNQVACGAYPDMETCLAAAGVTEGLGQLLAGVDDGRIDYDSGLARDCLDLVDSASSCNWVTGIDQAEVNDTCNGIFTGLVELGGECYASEDCAGDAACNLPCGSSECCAGTCVSVDPAPDPVGIGSDCSVADCVDGAFCNSDDVCTAVGGEGDPCSGFGSTSCEEGLYCDGIFEDSTCYRPADPGETCDPERGYGIAACMRMDNWCDPADNTCKARPDVGEDCDPQLYNCVAYAYCDESTNKCVATPGPGDACTTDGVDCLGDLECVNQVCVAPDPEVICGPES